MGTKNLDWTEKYRPKRLGNVIGNPTAIKQLTDWANSWARGRPKRKGAVLIGGPGIGKTTAAHALGRDFNWDIVELNASDQRNAAAIEKIVGHGSRANTFSPDGEYLSTSKGQLKLIIFDEADNLFGRQDYGGARAIVKALREAAQPVVLIVNDYYELTRRASGIKQQTISIRFTKPTTQQIVYALERIVQEEGFECTPEILLSVARNAGGDIRAAVNDLQSIASSDLSDPETIAATLGWRNVTPGQLDTVRCILTSGDPIAARQSLIDLDETPDRFILWLEDSLPKVIRDPCDRLRAFNAVSRADVFLGRVRRRQYYGLWSYASDMMSLGVCTAASDKYRHNSDRVRFPDYLSKLSRAKSRRNEIDAVIGDISSAYHTSREVARESILPYFRGLFINDREFAIEAIRTFDFDAGKTALLMGTNPDSRDVEILLEEAFSTDEQKDDFRPDVKIRIGDLETDESAQQRSLFEFD